MARIKKTLKLIPWLRRFFPLDPPKPMLDVDLGIVTFHFEGGTGRGIATLKPKAMTLILSVVDKGLAFWELRRHEGDEGAMIIQGDNGTKILFYQVAIFYRRAIPIKDTAEFYFSICHVPGKGYMEMKG